MSLVEHFIKSSDLELVKAITMSSSLPIVFRPIEYDNTLYCDGGLLNSYPICESLKYVALKNSLEDKENR